MADYLDTEWHLPRSSYVSVKRPRISGTALMGGLHLATGNYGTASPWRLALSGAAIAAFLGAAMGLTYIELWILDQFTGQLLASGLLGLTGPGATPPGEFFALAAQLLPMLNFLVVLRLSPLSGYHAAEHKVVSAIERYGSIEYEQVVDMPRAHPRCGTVLLFGVLPTLLIAYPLLSSNPLVAVAVAVIGWMLRYRVGYFIQQNFTTKPPTPRQLAAGIAAGRKLMALYMSDPDRRVSIARGIWTRGLPQMITGVVLGHYLLQQILDHFHVWLDF
jgi:hypothetical protein